MSRRRLFRRALTIAAIILAALTMVVGGIYAASLRYAFFVQTRTVSIEAIAGIVEVRHGGAPSSSITRHFWKLRHGTRINLSGHDWLIRLPLSYPTIALAVAAGAAGAPSLFRWLRPVPPGHCQRCRYDLRGLPPGPCPECGAPEPRTLGSASGV